MSDLRAVMAEYLSLRRSLGFKLERAARQLPEFVDYLEAAGATTVSTELALAWATQPPKDRTAWCAERLSIARDFAQHLAAIDPATEVPPEDLLRRRRRRAEPYLFSDTEITALMAAARELSQPLVAATHETLIGLLAVTGMRVGEVIGLDRVDVDVDGSLLVVRHAKFGKSRRLPLHPSTAEALDEYARTRDRLCPQPTAASFFVSSAGTRLIYNNVHYRFLKLAGRAGLEARSALCRPRPHDLRHSFAVRTLIDWYRQGVDVQARMPSLSTYMGHVEPSETYWYLHAAPELMALAGAKLAPSWTAEP